jgi:isoleucyl-tRNA synthetase
VLDCWFESGAMPYAQHHWPFEKTGDLSKIFPADFICEGMDQTRGWFYTLTVLSTLLHEQPAFKNVVVNGLVLAEDGRKMSKSLKNYPDPMHTLNELGADAVRLFLLSSPATAAEEVRFSIEGVKESTRRILLPLWNAYSFFATYASLDKWDPQVHKTFHASHEASRTALNTASHTASNTASRTASNTTSNTTSHTAPDFREKGMGVEKRSADKAINRDMSAERHISAGIGVESGMDKGADMDMWIRLKTEILLKTVDEAMSAYHVSKISPAFVEYFEDLNNWYIRRNRRRFWDADFAAHTTLYEVLVQAIQVLAPFAPFLTEYLFEKLTQSEHQNTYQNIHKNNPYQNSVHLTMLPEPRDLTPREHQLLERVDMARRVVELGRTVRVTHKIKNRQPLQTLTVGVMSSDLAQVILSMQDFIREELNVKEVRVTLEPESLARVIVKPNFKVLGKVLGEGIKDLQVALAELPQEEALKILRKQKAHVPGFEVSYDQCIVELRSLGSQLVATDAELVVALDSTLTEELKHEGMARELVSAVQKARKSAQFEVEDRISLSLKATQGHLQEAILKNKAYIEEETLSALQEGELAAYVYACEVAVEGEKIEIRLGKM